MAHLGKVSLEDLLAGAISDKPVVKRGQEKVAARDAGNILLVPIKAAAGYLQGFGDPEGARELPTFSLPMLGNGNYRAFEINGDSMLPLASGTVVVGEQVENLAALKNGKTYVLVTKSDGIVYKRVFNYLKENGKLFLVSDNTSYKPYSIQPDSILEAWASKAYISIQFPEKDVRFDPDKV